MSPAPSTPSPQSQAQAAGAKAQSSSSCCACQSGCVGNAPPSGASNDASSSAGRESDAQPALQDHANGQSWHYLRIPDMDCPSEEAQIRQALAGISGIAQLQFRFGERLLGLAAPAAQLPAALAAIRAAGFKVEHLSAASSAIPNARSRLWAGSGRLLLALGLAIAAELLFFTHHAPGSALTQGSMWLGMALAALAIALAGSATYRKGLTALRQGRLNINALMTVAVTGAFLIGQWPEAAMVMSLYALAEALEARAVDRTRQAIQGLLALAPQQAEVQQADGQWLLQPVADIGPGALLRVRPGERIALDGQVERGHSTVDQSPITGESLPLDKGPGDAVYAGTINQASELQVRASAPATDSTLARIILAVEQAQATRAPTQQLVDRLAAIYTPAVFAIALAVLLLLPLLGQASWLQALYQALVLLVIACPCALVISTPVTVISGLTAAARRGVLIKGGAYLEGARRIRAVALDKTGTITTGKPQLLLAQCLDDAADHAATHRLARSLAQRSDHPISQAIAQGLAQATQDADWPVEDFQAVAGRGVQGRIGAQPYVLANARWLDERGQYPAELAALVQAQTQQGHSVTLLADGQRALALYAVADAIKPSSAQAIAALKAQGVHTVMLSGDHLAAARHIATQAGIDAVHGELLPEDKLQAIAALQQRLGPTAMAGDGINDAPALAQADIGFAMGGMGTHVAMEAADVVVMNDDLRRLPETIALSRRTHALLWQNIALALGIKLLFLLLAMTGQASMWMAVFADMGASLLVLANGLRLLRPARAWADDDRPIQ
ncbi:heavy metal translocating P-type ATPase [Vandammella animalimorsus]|uniref:P-type Zn(2+) transporter n=1 Tax=Vandammella animalimorsus TaxID=2029117 RepID=A0A2A2A7Q0_9BURK|nr:heavy metal translocating P-type ATPase [Vandammella animalimorsus]PAT33768.1 heavy metal translocating P-type ATPase [Vandammella animalimorsus]